MKLVQLSCGKYAIRRGWFIHSYLDLNSRHIFWWMKSSKAFFDDCKADTIKEAMSGYETYKERKSKAKAKKTDLILCDVKEYKDGTPTE